MLRVMMGLALREEKSTAGAETQAVELNRQVSQLTPANQLPLHIHTVLLYQVSQPTNSHCTPSR
jgi:hypothetical protein